jgi:ABC-type multidrug transport system fused ATPase/permease subunit
MICVMHDGRIVESGTHLELVARRGTYARMFQTQFTDGEPKLSLAGA